MSDRECYCGCQETPAAAKTIDPHTNNPIYWECLTYVVNEGGETICSRSPKYQTSRADRTYDSLSRLGFSREVGE